MFQIIVGFVMSRLSRLAHRILKDEITEMTTLVLEKQESVDRVMGALEHAQRRLKDVETDLSFYKENYKALEDKNKILHTEQGWLNDRRKAALAGWDAAGKQIKQLNTDLSECQTKASVLANENAALQKKVTELSEERLRKAL